MSTSEASDSAESFQRAGFLGPIPTLSPAQCTLLARRYDFARSKKVPGWHKSLAVADRCIYDIATRPSILDRLELLLGPDIVLWGASFVCRMPGRVHGWHTDMESARPQGGFVSVWIGLKNTSCESALQLIPGSHLYGVPVQEMESQRNREHGSLNAQGALAWAKEHDPTAELFQPEMSNGDAILFDGRLWHGTYNQRETGARLALLLQYAQASAPVRRPQASYYGWPFVFTETLPPVLAVRGVPDTEANCILERPAAGPRSHIRLRRQLSSLRLPLDGEPGKRWTPHQMFRGSTRSHDFIDVHASVLEPGHSPHPPHVHIEEEILIVLDGRAEVLIGGPAAEDASVVAMPSGSFVYYPAWQFHTIRNVSNGPVNYLMFKWRSAPFESTKTLGVNVHHAVGFELPPSKMAGRTYRSLRLMERPTNFLGRLRAHVTEMEPGDGYEPHRDSYDVAIVVFSGRLDTGEGVIEPADVVYYAAGVLHGLRNAGEETARYLVLEFEDPETTASKELRRKAKAAAKKMARSTA